MRLALQSSVALTFLGCKQSHYHTLHILVFPPPLQLCVLWLAGGRGIVNQASALQGIEYEEPEPVDTDLPEKLQKLATPEQRLKRIVVAASRVVQASS